MATSMLSNRDQLKDVVLELLQEHPELLKNAVKELVIGSRGNEEETVEARQERIRALIQEDFDRFEDVFKALA